MRAFELQPNDAIRNDKKNHDVAWVAGPSPPTPIRSAISFDSKAVLSQLQEKTNEVDLSSQREIYRARKVFEPCEADLNLVRGHLVK